MPYGLQLLTAAILCAPAGAQHLTLTASDAGADDDFGSSVATDGARLAVGAEQDFGITPTGPGKAYVFDWTGAAWVETAILVPSDGVAGDGFGSGIAVCGDRVAVGAGGSRAVYVFDRAGTAWSETAKIPAPDMTPDRQFGDVVSVVGDVLAVAGDDLDTGLADPVYVFELQGTSWVQTLQTTGKSVHVDRTGDLVIVGDPAFMFSVGAARIYARDGSGWALEAQITVPNPSGQEFLGWSVAIDGDRAAASFGLALTQPVDATYVLEKGPTGWGVAETLGFGTTSLNLFQELLVAANGFAYRRHDAPVAGTRDTWPFCGEPLSGGASQPALGGDWLFLGVPSQEKVEGFRTPEASRFYCQGKPGTGPWLPQVVSAGYQGTGPNSGFLVVADNVPQNTNGLFFYGLNGPAALPFLGGTLCVQPPLRRTPIQNSGAVGLLYGSFTFDLEDWVAGGNDPAVGLGTEIHGQYWFRDNADPLGVGLTDAVATRLTP